MNMDEFVARGSNQAGRIGFGFGSGGSDQFDLLEEIRSNRVGSGSDQFICCVFSDL
jgi:hypothetical protein